MSSNLPAAAICLLLTGNRFLFTAMHSGFQTLACLQQTNCVTLQEEVSEAHAAIQQLGGEVVAVEPVESHSDHGQRTVIIVRKLRATPARLPRPVGVPKKQPLSADQ
jgi:hypothetical protein